MEPDDLKFKRPDFGFNNTLYYEADDPESPVTKDGWRKFLDCIKEEPKQERVRNYIDFVHTKKL